MLVSKHSFLWGATTLGLLGLCFTPPFSALLRSAELSGYPQISLKNQDLKSAVHEANERLRRDPQAPGKTPLSFYGQVVDENARPVEGVSIIMNWSNYSAGTNFTAKATSDAQGRFSLIEKHGDRLTLFLDKPGYYVPIAVKQTSFEFFQPGNASIGDGGRIYYYEPDSEHPFVFQLRKQAGSAKLIHKQVDVVPPVDGTPAGFDFTQGKLVPDGEGQMRLQTWKHITHHYPWYPFDWRVVLSIADGGFSEKSAQGEFAFEAAAYGYISTLDWPQHATGSLSADGALFKQLYFCYGEPNDTDALRSAHLVENKPFRWNMWSILPQEIATWNTILMPLINLDEVFGTSSISLHSRYFLDPASQRFHHLL